MAIRLLLIIFFWISAAASVSAAEKLPVFVSIVPQKYFVQQIGKDKVDVKVMVKPGASPATYEPKPLQMVEISKAKLYFAIGVPFENAWLKKISAANPDMRVIHTDDGIEKMAMAEHRHEEDEHQEEGHDNKKHTKMKTTMTKKTMPKMPIRMKMITTLPALTRTSGPPRHW